ncbi:MAG: inorganic phosphate transporter [Clostridia bacterium]|nr:inorganic phosphate transporter [Clostridia bacterium]
MKVTILLITTILIFTNALTDAPNAIATLVGTKTMKFKKAARLSATFNLAGIVVMSFINFSVANCLSSMVNLNDGELSYIVLISAIISVILFALIALSFGIPTSETHALIAGLTGAAIAIYGIGSVNINEWKNVIIGLVWSIVGTYFLSIITSRLFKNLLCKISDDKIKKAQIINTCGMSFMHGAQDGQKFIGILIIFICLLRNTKIPETADPAQYIEIILFTATIMAIGCSFGGKKIVENIGNDMASLDIRGGFYSDFATIITLLIASITRSSC